ncbi:hypothetical protein P0E61_13745, partial [Enterococcus faecalis]|nr:hypothetical protein [Enterococcus faecalis]
HLQGDQRRAVRERGQSAVPRATNGPRHQDVAGFVAYVQYVGVSERRAPGPHGVRQGACRLRKGT